MGLLIVTSESRSKTMSPLVPSLPKRSLFDEVSRFRLANTRFYVVELVCYRSNTCRCSKKRSWQNDGACRCSKTAMAQNGSMTTNSNAEIIDNLPSKRDPTKSNIFSHSFSFPLELKWSFAGEFKESFGCFKLCPEYLTMLPKW